MAGTKDIRLVLASASPRRRELLEGLGLSFEVHPSQVEEETFKHLPPAARVEALALAKAWSLLPKFPGCLIVGADTLVVCEGRVLGKPGSAAEAAAMLSFLSGRTHLVYTGVAVVRSPDGMAKASHAVTEVTFRPLTKREIRAYVASGEPLDKAGAYGIQGRGALLVKEIKGDYFNVVGLPLVSLTELLAQFGLNIWEEMGD